MDIELETRIRGRLIRRRPLEVGRQFKVEELDPFHKRYPLRYTLTILPGGIGWVSRLAESRVLVSAGVVTEEENIEAFFIPSIIPGVTYTLRCN